MLSGELASSYLQRGSYEPTTAFEKRKALADFRPYTRDLVSRLSGRLWTKAGDVTRDVPFDEGWYDSAGSEGESYETVLMRLTELLLAYDEVWVVLDPRTQRLEVVKPQYVPRWTSRAVIVKSEQSVTTDVTQMEEVRDVYTIYRPDAFEVVAPADSGEDVVDAGTYDADGRFFTDADGEPTPPALRFTLPFSTRYGLTVAKAHLSLYRMESRYDAAIGDALRGLLQLGVGDDEDMATRIRDAIRDGAIALPYSRELGEHRALSVGTDGLPFAQEALERKRRELYRVASSAEDKAGRQAQTATEAVLHDLDGSAAMMAVLATTMQSAEEDILSLVAQSLDARLTQVADKGVSAEWPTDFSTVVTEQPVTQ